MKEIAIGGAALMLIAAAPFNANAQKVVGWDGGAEPAHAVDAGTPDADFMNPQGFANRLEARIQASSMSAAQKRSAMAELDSIRLQLSQRMARKGGELRDWDRELINERLTRLSNRLGGAGTGV
jgi:hypothetical protein